MLTNHLILSLPLLLLPHIKRRYICLHLVILVSRVYKHHKKEICLIHPILPPLETEPLTGSSCLEFCIYVHKWHWPIIFLNHPCQILESNLFWPYQTCGEVLPLFFFFILWKSFYYVGVTSSLYLDRINSLRHLGLDFCLWKIFKLQINLITCYKAIQISLYLHRSVLWGFCSLSALSG